jgi:hypothetical protein
MGLGSDMDEAKKKRLEEKGWVVGDVWDFLECSDEEREELEYLTKYTREVQAKGIVRGGMIAGTWQVYEAPAFMCEDRVVLALLRAAKKPLAPHEIYNALIAARIRTQFVSSAVWRLVDTGKAEFTYDWKIKLSEGKDESETA